MPLPLGWTCHIKEHRLNLPRHSSSQASVASALNMHPAQYARIERGEAVPNALVAIQIARVLGVTVENLYILE